RCPPRTPEPSTKPCPPKQREAKLLSARVRDWNRPPIYASVKSSRKRFLPYEPRALLSSPVHPSLKKWRKADRQPSSSHHTIQTWRQDYRSSWSPRTFASTPTTMYSASSLLGP